jgi:hypothetical protein
LGHRDGHCIRGVVDVFQGQHTITAERSNVSSPHGVCTVQHAFVLSERVLFEGSDRDAVAQKFFDTTDVGRKKRGTGISGS